MRSPTRPMCVCCTAGGTDPPQTSVTHVVVPSLDAAQWDADVSEAVAAHPRTQVVTAAWISQSAAAKKLLPAAPYALD